MRLHHLILTSLVFCGSVQATEIISQTTLDQTLIQAQSAIEAQDYDQAFKLYKQAAIWGHKGAQYVLGELYIQGKGVAKDPVTGYAWLEVAAESRDRDFIRARKAAAKNLSEAQKHQADELAQKLASSFGLEAAGVSCRKEARIGSNIKGVNCYHVNTTSNGDLIVPDNSPELQPAS